MMCVFINNHQQKETLDHRSENADDEEAKVREMLDNLNWRLCYLNGIPHDTECRFLWRWYLGMLGFSKLSYFKEIKIMRK